MKGIRWNERLRMGVDELDEHHAQMIDLASQLRHGLTSPGPREGCIALLDELITCTRLHFSVEEAIQRVFAYEHHEAHKRLHEQILERADTLRGRYLRGDPSAGWALAGFLKEWVIHHLEQSDAHCKATLNGDIPQ